MFKTVDNIICSNNKTTLDFTGENLQDALCFGFSYIESVDHMVNYVVANAKTMKSILTMPEAMLNPSQDSLGELWTAKLLVSNKLADKRVIFSNNTFSAVINLNLNNTRS